MRGITRRRFLQAAGLGVAWLGGFRLGHGAWSPVQTGIPVHAVSVFSGPFLVDQLTHGQLLRVFSLHDKAVLALDEHLLGWLPENAAHAFELAMHHGQHVAVTVESSSRNREGRMELFVRMDV